MARDGSPTERVLEAAEDNRLIQAHWDIIEGYEPKPEVAILFDQDNALMTFAMSGNEECFHRIVPRLLQGPLELRSLGGLHRAPESPQGCL